MKHFISLVLAGVMTAVSVTFSSPTVTAETEHHDNVLTAMSLATPISSLIACITVGFSVGMNAELSKKLGEGDIDGANKAAGNGILVNWIVAGIFLIFGLFFVPMFYRLQTDNAIIQQIGTDYTSTHMGTQKYRCFDHFLQLRCRQA